MYEILAALYRLWTYEIHYNYDDEKRNNYIDGLDYIVSFLRHTWKTIYCDIHGGLYLSNNHIDQNLSQEKLSIYIYIVKIISAFIFFILAIGFTIKEFPLTQAWLPSTFGPLFIIGQAISIIFLIKLFWTMFYNIFQYFYYKIKVVLQAKTIHNLENLEKYSIQTFFETWFVKGEYQDKFAQIHDQVKDQMAYDVSLHDSFQGKLYKILNFFATGKQSVQVIIYCVIFGLIVYKSFDLALGSISTLPDLSSINVYSNKDVFWQVSGKLLLISCLSMLIVIGYLFVLWFLKSLVQSISNIFLKTALSQYPSETYEYELVANEKGEQQPQKVHDLSSKRQWAQMKCLLLAKQYAPHTYDADNQSGTLITKFSEEETQGVSYFDKKFIDEETVKILTSFDWKKEFVSVFFTKLTLSTIICYVVAFFILSTFVVWFESNPHRYAQKSNSKYMTNDQDSSDKEDKEDDDNEDKNKEEVSKRIKTYTPLLQIIIVITSLYFVLFHIYRLQIGGNVNVYTSTLMPLLHKGEMLIFSLIIVFIATYILFY
jgi:hypothetical protein